MTEISQDTPIAKFKRPDGLVTVEVDAFSGLLPGPGTVATVDEMFIKGTEPTRKDDLHVAAADRRGDRPTCGRRAAPARR